MDVGIIEQLFASLGTPVVVMIAAGFFIWKLWQQQVADKERLYVELSKAMENNKQMALIISTYTSKLDIIQDDVRDIKDKVGA